jgi:tripartite-type tricarboxylate transporter receptor subunit TctC
MIRKQGRLLRTALAIGCTIVPQLSIAQRDTGGANFPNRPVRIIVGFPAGSGTDTLARFIGAKLSDRFGQPVVIDNRVGANGIIAAELTTKAAPDGHTLMFMSTSHTMNAAIYKLPFDAAASFAPVALLGAGPLALVTNPAFPAANVKSLIELAQAKPKFITYAISGTGGVNHFAGALFARMAGIELVNVPYKGGPQAMTDVIAGQVQIMIGTITVSLPQIRAGRLRALGVSTARRTPQLPDVPTIAEAGVTGYELSIWWGVLAPAATPAPVVAQLNAAIGNVLAQADSAKRLELEGAQPATLSSAEFARMLVSEIDKWRRVARESNIKAE